MTVCNSDSAALAIVCIKHRAMRSHNTEQSARRTFLFLEPPILPSEVARCRGDRHRPHSREQDARTEDRALALALHAESVEALRR
mmetsp:Transcript_659/g.1251  ORF Transcript_659/g.1251 Transcript_659/m.1251 type:complete len:85 (+) Transcript_659:60-314(+)